MTGFINKLAGIKDEDEQDVTAIHSNDNKEKKSEQGSDSNSEDDKDWLDENYEGQLSVDVYGTEDEVVVVSTIAGVKPENIDISINNDMLTIRGERVEEKEDTTEDYYYQECYWGGFSRSIILPQEVEADKVAASLKNGVLTVRLPKAQKLKSVSVKVKEE
tara:strand:+ start:138 stop:620 length:483 start_codon:yes stop_codon:yes gene_type:complete